MFRGWWVLMCFGVCVFVVVLLMILKNFFRVVVL